MFAVPEHTVLRPSPYRQIGIAALVRSVAADPDRWRDLLRFAPGHPVRVPLRSTDGDRAASDAEVWLSGWLPGQRTPPHAHDERVQGAFAVVSGLLVERSWDRSRTLRPGQVRVFGPGYRHSLLNAGLDPAVTVHVELPARTVRVAVG
jgi:mannose-6-phosphate isomerase-like protein (cupin superfamily)